MQTTDSHVLAPIINKMERRSQLGLAERQALLNLPCKVVSHDKGSYLIREHDKPASCILVISGFVYRSKITGDGLRQLLAVHLYGDLIDPHANPRGEADHNVQALMRAEVAYIPQQALRDVAESYPAVALALCRDAMAECSISREWLLNVGRRNARQRIAHLLCELTVRQEEAGLGKKPSYQWPMTQEQMGEATGLTGVHVNRTLQRLRKEGLIAIANQSVTIHDWARLQRAGDFNNAYLHQRTITASDNP